jgi:hypothetical protein
MSRRPENEQSRQVLEGVRAERLMLFNNFNFHVIIGSIMITLAGDFATPLKCGSDFGSCLLSSLTINGKGIRRSIPLRARQPHREDVHHSVCHGTL